MKHLKQFEAFTLPGRNPVNLINTIFSDLTDEFGGDVIIIKQVLRKAEVLQLIDEYLIPGIGRVEDEGFKFKPQKANILDKIGNKLLKTDEMWHEGVHIKLNGGDTIFYLSFKNDLK